MAKRGTVASRGTVELVASVRRAIEIDQYANGQFLPPVRELSEEYGISPETVRRGLKVLESEGLVVAEPRQGFRVTAMADDVLVRCPVAYVTGYSSDLGDAQPANWAVSRALSEAAARRGWTTLGVHLGGRDLKTVARQLNAAQAWGAVLDTLDTDLLQVVRRAGLPVVMVNSWIEEAEVDVVLQDNYRGGFLAAKHLAQSGAERIAWMGPVAQFCHSRERFAGAVAGLAACGREFAVVADTVGEAAARDVRALLSNSGRPDGALVFWKSVSSEVVNACGELGLRLGRDLKVVGWSVEEFYASEHRAVFAGGAIPPAVVWKAPSMAEAALDRLEQIRKAGRGEPLRVNVPTRLRIDEQEGR